MNLTYFVAHLCLILPAHFIIGIDAKHKHKKSPPPPSTYPSPPPLSPMPPTDTGGSKTFDVVPYVDGSSDATDGFQKAWSDACAVGNAVVLVPAGNDFLVKPTVFDGQKCHAGITFELQGTILAPTAIDDWGTNPENWISFEKVQDFQLTGTGTFDGQAMNWWESNPSDKPTAVRFGESQNVNVTSVTFKRSPQAHLKFDGCDGVVVIGIAINSPEDSPNTDGIHMGDSTNVYIHDSKISCGDDCISIGPGCSGITIDQITCGPSHGISIGSLGENGEKSCVSNITVTNSIVKYSDNGVRLKSYQGGSGVAEDITFSNIQVTDVKVAINIDQYYAHESNTNQEGSAVSVRNIIFDSITGEYTKDPITIMCSSNAPCTNIQLSNIDLSPSPGASSTPTCQYASGTVTGKISDAVRNCLNSNSPNQDSYYQYYSYNQDSSSSCA